jgi:hypothetical protein
MGERGIYGDVGEAIAEEIIDKAEVGKGKLKA